MRRRDFIVALGSVMTLPDVAEAQQSNMPVIGAIVANPETGSRSFAAYRRGLAETGRLEGRDFRFEPKYTLSQYDRLPGLFRELVEQKASLIIVASTATLAVAKKCDLSIPIVFTISSDPVENGFVESLTRPGGNMSGMFTNLSSTSAKRLALLRDLLPSAKKFAFLTNPNSPKISEAETRELSVAASNAGISLLVVAARNPGEFGAAFESAVRENVDGLIVSLEGMFIANPDKLVELAAQHRLPAIFADDVPSSKGGLMSFGADLDDSFRSVGVYAGRVLNGEKPSTLPVHQSTKTKLVINLKVSKDLGITVPPMLLSRADEVIE